MSFRQLALYEAHVSAALTPHATRVCDPRAVGLIQVKAVGLVVVSDHNLPPPFIG